MIISKDEYEKTMRDLECLEYEKRILLRQINQLEEKIAELEGRNETVYQITFAAPLFGDTDKAKVVGDNNVEFHKDLLIIRRNKQPVYITKKRWDKVEDIGSVILE